MLTVVLRPETIIKICPRLFLPVRIKNGKKCVPNSLGILQLSKLSHPGPIFNFDCFGGPRDRKGQKNSTETFFSRTDRKTIRTAYRIMWVFFWCKTESYGPDFQPFRPGGTEAQKVIKTRPNYFSTVLTGNDRNCTTNCVCMLRVPNVVIWVRFSTLAAQVVLGPRKGLKIRPKHFFSVLMRNEKNCVSK